MSPLNAKEDRADGQNVVGERRGWDDGARDSFLGAAGGAVADGVVENLLGTLGN